MDLTAIIQSLYTEKKRLDLAIARLEQVNSGGFEEIKRQVTVRSRRGRKSMGPEERKQVAARIKNYWAKRRRGGGETTEKQADR
jgi:hypothetical protein